MKKKGRKRRRSPENERKFERGGGSASRISGDQSSTDPGGGSLPNKQGGLPWQIQRDDGGSSQWKVDSQEFPSLGTQKTARKVNGSADPMEHRNGPATEWTPDAGLPYFGQGDATG